MKLFYCINVFLFVLTALPLAAEVTLFDSRGNPVANYHDVVDALKKGQTVVFSDGRKVKLGKKLGEGTNAAVFRVDGTGQVIKILSRTWSDKVDYFNQFIEGRAEHAQIKGLNVPEIGDYRKGEYVFVAELDLKWTLAELFHGEKQVQKSQIEPLKEALRRFARDSAMVRRTADYSMDNIGFDGKNIVLIDWAKGIELAKDTLDRSSIFTVSRKRFKVDQGWRELKKILGEDFFQELSDIVVRTRVVKLGASSSCPGIDLHTSPPRLGQYFK